MTIPLKIRPGFKAIAIAVAFSFLYQQISWAADVAAGSLDSSIDKLNSEQSQTFAPSYLQDQQAIHESIVNQKQLVEDLITIQNSTPSTFTTAPAETDIALQGPHASDPMTAAQSPAPAILEEGVYAPASDSAVLSVTTQEGDVVYYASGAVDHIIRKDGTALKSIAVDENNNLIAADILYPDGTNETIAGGKVIRIIKPDGAILNYDEDENLSSILYPSDNTVTFSYIKDAAGCVTETILTDAEKVSRYGSDNKLKSVKFNSGRKIEYQDGAILSITEEDGSLFTFDLMTGSDGSITSSLSQYLAANGNVYKYSMHEDGSAASITVEKDGIIAAYDKGGNLINVTKDGRVVNNETIAEAQAAHAAAGVALDNARQAETQAEEAFTDSQNILFSRQAILDEKIAARRAAEINVENFNTELVYDQLQLAQILQDLTQSLDAEASAQIEYDRVQAEADARQTAYDAARQNREAAELELNGATDILAVASQVKRDAENALSDGNTYIVSAYVNSAESITLSQNKNFIYDQFDSYNSNLWYKPADPLVMIGGGAAILNGTGKNYNATLYTNQSYSRSDKPVMYTTFKISSTSGKFIAALDGHTSSNAYRRVGIYAYGGNIYLQTVTGTMVVNKTVLLSGAKANINYTVEFEATSQDIKIYLWESAARRPAAPSYTYTVTDWSAVRPYYSLYSGTAAIDYVTMRGPDHNSTYGSDSRLVKDVYQNGNTSVYSYSQDAVTVRDYNKYLDSPYDLSTPGLWYKPSETLVMINSGAATLKGTGLNYNAAFYSNQTFLRADNPTVRSTFQATSAYGKFIASLDGYAPTGSYRRLGVIMQSGRIYVQTVSGSSTSTPKTLIATAKANTNYTVEFQITSAYIKVFLWESSAQKPAAASYTYVKNDYSEVRPYYSVYSGVATVSNVCIYYTPQVRTVLSTSQEYSRIMSRNQLVWNLRSAIANETNARQARDLAQSNLTAAQAVESQAEQALAVSQDALAAAGAVLAEKVSVRQIMEENVSNLNSEIIINQAQLARAQADLDQAIDEELAASAARDQAGDDVSVKQAAYEGAIQDRENKEAVFNDTAADLAALNALLAASPLFPQLDLVLMNAGNKLKSVVINYDGQGRIQWIRNIDGSMQTYADGLITGALYDSALTLYAYDLTALNNINGITVDRSGIKRIYDQYGNIKSLSLDGAAKIVYENGQVREVQKADGIAVKNMTFRDSGELDSALVSYPDGSLALYSDARLLQLISASGDITDYGDGKIRRVTLEDGTVYDWSYDGSNIVILDNAKQERRIYLEGRLLQLEELTGAKLITRYYYDEVLESLIRSEICRNNEILYTYTYAYEKDCTIVRDEDGNAQAYTKDKRLSYIIDSKGRKYSYTYVGKNEGYIEVYFPSGNKARYNTDGDIIDIAKSDGTVIKDITFDGNNIPRNLTYIKDGSTYKVEDGKIREALSKDGADTLYYDNGFIRSIETESGDLTEYQYFVKDNKTFNRASTFLRGDLQNLSLYGSSSDTYLELSQNSLQFGAGTDGVKRVSADETLSAGVYNFESLTIDPGKTLTVGPDTIIKVLGTVAVNGAIFCSGSFDIYTPDFNVLASGSITGAVNIKCGTINNAGTITGNACITGLLVGGSESVRDDDFNTAVYNHYWGDGDTAIVTFPSCDIATTKYHISVANYGLNANASVYLLTNGNWVNLLSYSSGNQNSGVVENTTGWSNVTGMMMTGQSYNGDCVSSGYGLYEMQAIIGTPTIEYISGNPGTVNTSLSRPTANIKQPDYPSSGTFESEIIELNALGLGAISWSQELPEGTNITFQTRTGDTAVPDVAWSEWSAELAGTSPSQIISPKGKYIQYRINLSTADPGVTPILRLGENDPIRFDYDRAPSGAGELSNIDYATVLKDGVTNTYDKESWQSIIPDPIFDSDDLDSIKNEIPKYLLNDTQKEIYLRDSIIISELTAIKSVDGTVTEYCQGQISKITGPDGTVITDIDFDADNNASAYTYYKEGSTYQIKDGAIDAVITAAGERIEYYSYGLINRRTFGDLVTEYEYGSPASEACATVAALGSGAPERVSLFENGGMRYLALSDTSFKYGTGIDGAKYVTSDETLSAGSYNFTSLTVDAGKALKVAPGTVINILGTAVINGSIFCGGTCAMNAYDVNIAFGASITGAVNIKCDTINNAGIITGNAAMTGTLSGDANEADRDDNFSGESHGFRYNVSGSGGATPIITFPAGHISYIRASASGDGNAGHGEAYFYIRVNGSWQYTGAGGAGTGNPGWGFNISGATHYDNGGMGWDNADAIMASISAYASGGVGRAYMQEMQAIIGTPTIEYTSGNPGIVNTSESRPTAIQKQVTNPGSGSFESSVMELNALTLGSLSWSQEVSAGTAAVFQTRTGDTAIPDAAWTDWSAPLTNPDGSAILSPGKKYLQYKITFTTADPSKTPKVIINTAQNISVGYTRISDNPLDPYVKVKTGGITNTYNKNGVNIADSADTINVDSLKFDSAYIDTLKDDIPSHKLSDAQKVITVYDKGNDTPVEIITAAQLITYFDNGYATKVLDKNGVLQVQYTYDENKNVVKVELVDARAKLEENYRKAVLEIVTQREEALAKLSAAEANSRDDIALRSADILRQIGSERQRLSIEMAKYDPNVYDLSEFGGAFVEMDSYEARTRQQALDAYTDLDRQVAAARSRIEADAATAMQDIIDNDYNKILADIVQKESTPLIYQYYRKVLGRDPEDSDLLYWTDKVTIELASVTADELTQYLENLSEYTERHTRKQNIISGLTSFFTQYLSASDTEKQTMLLPLNLSSDEVVNIAQSDIDSILSWLNGQSLHFGDSAFETVISMLSSEGIDKSFEEIGKDAIKIDILSGVVTKEATGDLVISMYAMRKSAQANGFTLYSSKVTYDDLKEMVSRSSVTVHIDGKHYVLVTGIDDAVGTVTYIDSTVGQNGQEMIISRAEFMERWKGYSLAKELPQDPAKHLNVTQEKNIRGSGWWEKFWRGIVNFFQKIIAPVATILLMIPPLASVGAILLGINIIIQTISFVVHTGSLMDVVWSVVNTVGAAIGASILPGIYEAAGKVFSSIGQAILAPLQGVFSAVMPIFNNLSTAVSNIATGIGHIVSLGTASTEIAASIGYNIITQGVSLGTDFLFKSLNLDPSLAHIGSALFTGAVMGVISPNTNIVAEAVKYGTIAGVDELGEAIDLDPNITHLAAIMSGSFVGGALAINGCEISYAELMQSISPNIASECAYIGVTEIGEMLGVDPRISYLAGVGIRSTINAGLTHEFMPDVIWGSVTQGLLQGVTNIGLNFATEELGISPLLANIGFSAISGAINAGIQAATGGSKDVFGSLFKTYTDNALTFLGSGDPSNAWQQAAYISQILDFSDIVQQRGLVDALNTYGAGFFNAVAVNQIVQSGYTLGGYFAEKLQAGQYANRTLQDGTEVKVVTIKDGQGNTITNVLFQEKQDGASFFWDVVGREDFISDGSYLGWGELGVDAYGKLGYTDADLYSIFNSDIQYQQIVNGQQTYAEIKDSLGNTLLIIEPTESGHYNVYDSYGEYVDAKINTLLSGKTYSFDDALLKYYQELDSTNSTSLFGVDFSDPGTMGLLFNSLSLSSSDIEMYHFTPEQIQQITYVLFNGINNPCPEGLSPAYIRAFQTQLALADPSGATIKDVAMFPWGGWNTSHVISQLGDGVAWIRNAYLGSHELTDDLITGMQMQFGSQIPPNMIGVAYSGSGDPLIQAVNSNPDWDMESIVLIDTPIAYGRKITNSHVSNVIMVTGMDDLLAGIGSMEKDFNNNLQPLNVYKIALIGVGHTDFASQDSNNTTAMQVGRFSAYTTTLANNKVELENFLNTAEGITYDSGLNMYVVDLSEVTYEN